MQGSGARGAISSASAPCHYDVLLSFRSDETGRNFTDHLHAALAHGGFHTFRYDDGIRRCKNIISETHTDIRESSLSVIVFSKGYASSRWCLNELAEIMERRRTQRHHVLPVFYDVDPTEVKKQTRNCADDFFNHGMQSKEEVDKVERWKRALREVTALKGMVLGKRYESVFIKDIVKEVRKKLDKPMAHVTPQLVGRRDLVNEISLWVQNGTTDAGIATIYGIGGVGKTTVAKVVFNLNYSKFEGSCFLGNIREVSAEANGLIHLQKQLLSHLLKQKDQEIFNVDEGILKIRAAISCRRVLVVLDDLDDLDQFNAIVGMRKWFCPGSKVIITTRHKRLLKRHDISKKFKVRKLAEAESLQLLCWHAFGQDHPLEGYVECSTSIVKHCDGLPLALQVLGSSLSGKSTSVWESALQKLETIVDNKIQKALRLSYDSLEDDHDKNLFLDVACFFVGKDVDLTVTILEASGYYSAIGIQNLLDRFLVSVDVNDALDMHQLLRDMGREIVRLESPEDPGKRSRLWHDRESFDFLREKRGSEKVRGLSLDMRKLKELRQVKTLPVANCEESFDFSVPYSEVNCLKRQRLSLFSWRASGSSQTINEENLETNALGKIPNLKLLHVNNVRLVGAYKEFPKSLAWLCWSGFPLESVPADLCLDNLVALEMRNGRLRHNWKGGKYLQNLKILDLSRCDGLVSSPDFRGLPSLERLMLKYCLNLVGIDKSIACLPNLLVLDLEGCKNLQNLPREICMLKALEKLVLSGCSKLEELPSELVVLESMGHLYLDGTAIMWRASNENDMMQIGSAGNRSWTTVLLSWLFPRKTPRPRSISVPVLPQFLVELSLANCNLSDENFNINFHGMHSLQILELDGNNFDNLPESIFTLDQLNFLYLRDCMKLQTLPQLPKNLLNLDLTGCISFESIQLSTLTSSVIVLNRPGTDIEVGGLLKLMPVTVADREVIRNLGLFNLESIKSIEVEMFSSFSNRRKKGPLQVLHEYGISSIFLPEATIPDWYSYHTTAAFVSINVPPRTGQKLHGLNIGVIFSENSTQVSKGYPPASPDIVIQNQKNGKKWIYCPSYFGIATNEQHILWLSHWCLADGIEFGDTVNICFSPRSELCLLIKECAVHLVYGAETSNELLRVQEAVHWCQTVPETHFSMKEIRMSVADGPLYLHHLQRNKPLELLQ